ncbi:MAG: tetratricopeptide repeat protein [Myxococcota bacterium]
MDAGDAVRVGAERALAPRLAVACLLAAAMLAVYAQAADHQFVNLDDSAYVLGNPRLREPLTPAALARDFARPFFANWAPLTLVSYHVNYAIHGAAFPGYLWTNVALHLLATLLLFAALDRMTGRLGASAFVAAVFALHPLHVESVAWVSSRKDVLAGCFWMAGLLAHARYAEQPGSLGRYLGVFACLVLGLLSKALLVTFPFALLLLDHWPLRRLTRRAVLEKLPMLAIVAVFSAITLWAQREGGATAFAEAHAPGPGLRLANAIDAIAAYLRQAFWPTGLAVHYPYPRHGLPVGRVVAEAAGLLALSGWAVAGWRRRPWAAVGWLWFLGVLVPMLGLIQVGSQARADRYTYVPLIGLAIVVAWGVPALLARARAPRWLAEALGSLAALALAAVAFVQVGHWRSSETLYVHAVAVAPESSFAQSGLGLVRIEQERWQEAEAHLERAFRLRPDLNRPALVRLHLLRARKAAVAGEEAERRALLTRVLEVDPGHRVASGLLGASLVRAGHYETARPLLERALEDPEASASVYASLGRLELAEGHEAAAVRATREALRRDPDLAWAANNLAWILATSADPALRAPDEAVALAEGIVVDVEAADPNHLDTLAAAYASAGRFDQAVATAERGIARAEAQGDAALAASLRVRRERYRAGRASPKP